LRPCRGGSRDLRPEHSPPKPSYVEVPLPASTLVAGTNVLTVDKTAGSWHVYDALGVFRR
jgi:hypothetical protein